MLFRYCTWLPKKISKLTFSLVGREKSQKLIKASYMALYILCFLNLSEFIAACHTVLLGLLKSEVSKLNGGEDISFDTSKIHVTSNWYKQKYEVMN